MIQTIAFNLENTLVNREYGMRFFLQDWATRHPEAIPPDQLHRIISRALVKDASGYVDTHTFCQWFIHQFKPEGVTPEMFEESLRKEMPSFIKPDVWTVNLLRVLRSRFRLALVTNGEPGYKRGLLETVGLNGAFDDEAVFISDEVGVSKPDGGIFTRVIQWCRHVPANILFVGYHPLNDIAGASGVGFQTCWISNNRTYPDDLPQPDHTIADLKSLRHVLGFGI